MKNVNNDVVNADLADVHRESVTASSDVDTMVVDFNRKFLEVWNKHAPIISHRVRKHHTSWMQGDVLDLLHKRDHQYRLFLKSRTEQSHNMYKVLRNAVTNAVRRAKQDFFIRGARSGSRFFWQHDKRCTGLGKIMSTLLPWPCHNATASKASANRINNKFIDTVT